MWAAAVAAARQGAAPAAVSDRAARVNHGDRPHHRGTHRGEARPGWTHNLTARRCSLPATECTICGRRHVTDLHATDLKLPIASRRDTVRGLLVTLCAGVGTALAAPWIIGRMVDDIVAGGGSLLARARACPHRLLHPRRAAHLGRTRAPRPTRAADGSRGARSGVPYSARSADLSDRGGGVPVIGCAPTARFRVRRTDLRNLGNTSTMGGAPPGPAKDHDA